MHFAVSCTCCSYVDFMFDVFFMCREALLLFAFDVLAMAMFSNEINIIRAVAVATCQDFVIEQEEMIALNLFIATRRGLFV